MTDQFRNMKKWKWQIQLKVTLLYLKNVSSTENITDVTNMNLTHLHPIVFHCLLSNDNIVTGLIPLLHSQNAPRNNNNLWSDLCVLRVWKLVKVTEDWQFSMEITVWDRGRFTDGWKDSKENGTGVDGDAHSDIIAPATPMTSEWFSSLLGQIFFSAPCFRTYST